MKESRDRIVEVTVVGGIDDITDHIIERHLVSGAEGVGSVSASVTSSPLSVLVAAINGERGLTETEVVEVELTMGIE